MRPKEGAMSDEEVLTLGPQREGEKFKQGMSLNPTLYLKTCCCWHCKSKVQVLVFSGIFRRFFTFIMVKISPEDHLDSVFSEEEHPHKWIKIQAKFSLVQTRLHLASHPFSLSCIPPPPHPGRKEDNIAIFLLWVLKVLDLYFLDIATD